MKTKSFAKINLGLEVMGKREDNYHEIRTLFQSIDLYDVLEFIPIKNNRILLEGDDKNISWGRDNLIFRAALLLKEKFSLSDGIEIYVTKNIPPGKGLGGGSSNAAMTLFALNRSWELNLGMKDLMDLGMELGADVPFFLEGGLCLGTGRGDNIIPLADLDSFLCLLALPLFSISTSHVYSHFQLSLTSKDKDSKIIRFLANREFGSLENKLEETVLSLYPQLRVIRSLFQSQGSELTLISGTGSAVFGLFRERREAEKSLIELKRCSPSLLVEILSRERYWSSLSVGV